MVQVPNFGIYVGDTSLEAYNKHIYDARKNHCAKIETGLKSTDKINKVSANVKKQLSIQSSFENSKLISQNEFDKRLLKFITSSMSAVTIISNPDFINLFKGTELQVMSRFTAMLRICKMNNEIKEIIKKSLQNVEYVCTTADIWSSKKKSFFGITCHWITEDLNRKSVALACRRFSGLHSYDNIADLLDDIHSEFNLNSRKIIATSTDNASNFVKAFKEFCITSKFTTTATYTERSEDTVGLTETEMHNSDEEIESDSEEDEEQLNIITISTTTSVY